MLSDDVETAQTVYMMDELAERDAPTRTVISATHEALSAAGLQLDSDAEQKARAIYWYLKRTIRYVPIPGTSPLVDQTLIPPASVLAMPDPEADCPQFSMLASAMLRVCCVPSNFKTIAADPAYPDTYSHVYNMVDLGNGQYLPFDSSNGPAPGAEYSHPSKARVWPQRNPTSCRTAARKAHTAMLRTSSTHRGFRNSALRGAVGIAFLPLSGLGDVCDQDGNCYDSSGSQTFGSYDTLPTTASPILVSVAPVTPVSGVQAQNDAAANAQGLANLYAGSTTPAPSSGANAYSLATAALADATTAAAPIIKAASQQAPYYITGPNGQAVLYNPNTGATGAAAASVSSSLGTLSPTTLLIGALIIAALTLTGKK
jgi:hypothetical protein